MPSVQRLRFSCAKFAIVSSRDATFAFTPTSSLCSEATSRVASSAGTVSLVEEAATRFTNPPIFEADLALQEYSSRISEFVGEPGAA